MLIFGDFSSFVTWHVDDDVLNIQGRVNKPTTSRRLYKASVNFKISAIETKWEAWIFSTTLQSSVNDQSIDRSIDF